MRRTQATVLMMLALTGTLVACSFQPSDVGPQSDPSGQAKIQPRQAPSEAVEQAAGPVDKPGPKKTKKQIPSLPEPEDAEPARTQAPKPGAAKPGKQTESVAAEQPKQAKPKPAKPKPAKPKPKSAKPKPKPAKPEQEQTKAEKPEPADDKQVDVAPPTEEPVPEPTKSTEPASPMTRPERNVGDIVELGIGALWWPSFQVMPLAEEGQAPEGKFGFSHEGWTPEEMTLYTAFHSAPVPAHACGTLPSHVPEPDETVAYRDEMEPLAQRYANCLYDAWRPTLTSIGAVPYEKIVLTACPGEGCDMMEPNYAALATEDHIYLSEFVEHWAGPYLTRVIAHETAHVIQSSVRASTESYSVVSAGIPIEDDHWAVGRAHELQAECLSSAMIDKALPLPHDMHILRFPTMSADELHGDWESIEFWTGQGLKGRVGECNAYIADPSLRSYRPWS